MSARPSILCPIDFSEASAGALRYAGAIADHFAARLVVLSVEDPLLTQAADLGTGVLWTPEECKHEIAQFAAKTFGADSPALAALEYEAAVGKPAPEILRIARERSCDLIVISTHGLTGIRKLFFGSTTERVLRETTQPVLITPVDPGVVRVEDARRLIRRILVPVDLSPASLHQTQVARGLADALDLRLILAHVIETGESRLAGGSIWRRSGRPAVDCRRRHERADGDDSAPAASRSAGGVGDPAGARESRTTIRSAWS